MCITCITELLFQHKMWILKRNRFNVRISIRRNKINLLKYFTKPHTLKENYSRNYKLKTRILDKVNYIL